MTPVSIMHYYTLWPYIGEGEYEGIIFFRFPSLHRDAFIYNSVFYSEQHTYVLYKSQQCLQNFSELVRRSQTGNRGCALILLPPSAGTNGSHAYSTTKQVNTWYYNNASAESSKQMTKLNSNKFIMLNVWNCIILLQYVWLICVHNRKGSFAHLNMHGVHVPLSMSSKDRWSIFFFVLCVSLKSCIRHSKSKQTNK